MDAEIIAKCSESAEEGIVRWTLWGFRSGGDKWSRPGGRSLVLTDDTGARKLFFPTLLQ